MREIPGSGLVRVSCGWWTNEDDLARLPPPCNSLLLGGRPPRFAGGAPSRSAAARRRRSRCARPARPRSARRPRTPRRGARRRRRTVASASSSRTWARARRGRLGRRARSVDESRESSSHAKSVFFSGVSRGGSRCAACERIASIHVVGIALLAEDRRAVLGMLVESGMHLIIEVVEERDDAPRAARRRRAGAAYERRRGLDRERMPKQRLALRVARQRLPGPSRVRAIRPLRYPGSCMHDYAEPRNAVLRDRGRGALSTGGSRRRRQDRRPADPRCRAVATEPVELSTCREILNILVMVNLVVDIGAGGRVNEQEQVGVVRRRTHLERGSTPSSARRCRASFLLAGPLPRPLRPRPSCRGAARRDQRPRLDPRVHTLDRGSEIEVRARPPLGMRRSNGLTGEPSSSTRRT